MTRASALATTLFALSAVAASAQPSKRSSEDAQTLDLPSLADARDRAVRTHGTLAPLKLPDYWTLSEDGVSVALIPVPEIREVVQTLAGHRVEVVGLVRALPSEDSPVAVPPDLPPLPGTRDRPANWPTVSISIWSIVDLGLDVRRRDVSRGRLGMLLAGAPGKTVAVVGRFCGAAPCGALSAAAMARAWAIQDGDDAVWVLGKQPRGKGFRLDPDYPGDRGRWLQVTGKLERCGTDWCLRAREVTLAPAPSPADTQ